MADDAALLRDCHIDTYRASGPGGQKRNKTSSAVRLRHGPTGLMVIAEESRSQHDNKARALRRLRMAMALRIRADNNANWSPPVWWEELRAGHGIVAVSSRNPKYPMLAGLLLDVLTWSGGQVSRASARLGISTGQMSKLLTADDKVLVEVNRIRREAGLKELK